jgi:hypothetical protein
VPGSRPPARALNNSISQSVMTMVESMPAVPLHVVNRYLDVLYTNPIAQALSAGFRVGTNFATIMFHPAVPRDSEWRTSARALWPTFGLRLAPKTTALRSRGCLRRSTRWIRQARAAFAVRSSRIARDLVELHRQRLGDSFLNPLDDQPGAPFELLDGQFSDPVSICAGAVRPMDERVEQRPSERRSIQCLSTC